MPSLKPAFLLPTALLAVWALCAPAWARQSAKPDLNEWRQYCGSADHNNFRALEDVITCPEMLWHVPEAYSAPAVFKEHVYSSGKSLRKIELATGRVLASVPAGEGEEAAYFGTPVVLDDRVVAVKTSGVVEAFKLDLGAKLWEADLSREGGRWGSFPPAFSDGLLVVAGGAVVAIDPADGKLAWKADSLEGAVEMAPAVSGGRVFFGTSEGRLYALDLKTGKEAWKTQNEVQFGWSSPVVADGRIFLSDRGGAGRRGAFHAFDEKTGKELWLADFGATGSSTPGIGPDAVFWGFGRFVALYDQKTGKLNEGTAFRTDFNPFGSPTLVGSSMIFGNLDGYLYVFDFKSGRLKWRFCPKAAGDEEKVQVLDFVYLKKGVILVSTSKGLFCLGQAKKASPVPPGFLLEFKPQPKTVTGKVVEIRELESGLSLYVIEPESGEKVEVATDKKNHEKWLVQSWEGKCKVKVEYVESRADGETVNRIVTVSPSK